MTFTATRANPILGERAARFGFAQVLAAKTPSLVCHAINNRAAVSMCGQAGLCACGSAPACVRCWSAVMQAGPKGAVPTSHVSSSSMEGIILSDDARQAGTAGGSRPFPFPVADVQAPNVWRKPSFSRGPLPCGCASCPQPRCVTCGVPRGANVALGVMQAFGQAICPCEGNASGRQPAARYGRSGGVHSLSRCASHAASFSPSRISAPAQKAFRQKRGTRQTTNGRCTSLKPSRQRWQIVSGLGNSTQGIPVFNTPGIQTHEAGSEGARWAAQANQSKP